MATDALTEEQRQTLLGQFVDSYAEAQKTYDTSVRTLAAAGVAVTASLATALRDMPTSGKCAVGLFIASLVVNLLSYGTWQLDIGGRLKSLRSGGVEGIEGNNWTTTTTWLNFIAGATFIVGAVSSWRFS